MLPKLILNYHLYIILAAHRELGEVHLLLDDDPKNAIKELTNAYERDPKDTSILLKIHFFDKITFMIGTIASLGLLL